MTTNQMELDLMPPMLTPDTRRRLVLLILMPDGRNDKEIAEEVGCAASTVSDHRKTLRFAFRGILDGMDPEPVEEERLTPADRTPPRPRPLAEESTPGAMPAAGSALLEPAPFISKPRPPPLVGPAASAIQKAVKGPIEAAPPADMTGTTKPKETVILSGLGNPHGSPIARGPPVKAGQDIDLVIEEMGKNGCGVARVVRSGERGGFIIFVSNTDPGDKVKARITRVQDTYAMAVPLAKSK